MFGGFDETRPGRSAALITGLTVLALAAMATAIPPGRLTPRATDVERGYLASGASFSDMLAQLLNGDGYTYMAVDLTHATLRAGEVWRVQFDEVSRIFPVWGFVDVRGGVEQARGVATSLPISGIFLYGAKPEDVEAMRAAKPGLRVVPIVAEGASWTGKGDVAVALSPGKFAEAGPEGRLPVLLAASLKEAEIEALRAKVTGDYLVCSIAIQP